jgi:hypothetical protein
MAHRRLAESERLGQVAHARLVTRLRLDQAEQPQARRVGDRLQCAGQLLGVLRLEWLLK